MTSSVICVDIGGTSTKAGVLGPLGELHFVESIPTLPDCNSYAQAFLALVGSVREKAGSDVRGVGVAVAGFLNPARDRLVYNPNLSWLEGFPLRDRLVAHLDLPVELEVDSNCACMAEQKFGCGVESRRFLCLTAGTGLGVGMAIDGEPLRFAYGCLGDIGHVIVQPGGPLCGCGGRGCAEVLVSAPLLAKRFAANSLRDVIEAAREQNSLAVTILREAGEWLGLAIASMANTLFPDQIAVAGGLSEAGDLVLKPAERVFRESASTLAHQGVRFDRARLGSSATLMGAAWPFWTEVSSYGESIAR